MYKKLLVAVISLTLFTGCAAGDLTYDGNLGYDLNNVSSSEIVFNVYHSGTKDGSWEKIASFPCNPQPGHRNDVKLVCMKNQITVELWDDVYTESEDGNSASYDVTVESSKKITIDGFNGNLTGWKDFDIKNREGEQFVRLYPISNSKTASYPEDIDLNKPYETDDTIDNILITIVMK